ncbi:MAG: transporter [Prevotellaceae bacterium]|nr:transporter [Prevotellaceae bacterium]
MTIKKALMAAVVSIAVTMDASAGGLLTNTNQNVAFLRNPARDAAIGIDGVYSNPAGVAFMPEGWYASFNFQNAHQTRTIESTFAGFAGNVNNLGQKSKTFKGEADVAVIPSVQVAKNWKKWSFQFNFAITGGGGKCTFDNGLGSIESLVSLVPGVFNALGGTLNSAAGGAQLFPTQNVYSMDTYLRGRQYYYGYTLGAAYRINDNWSVYGGLRLLYGTANYYGYVRNIQLHTQGSGMFPSAATENLGKWVTDHSQLVKQALGNIVTNSELLDAAMPLMVGGIDKMLEEGIQLNCDQDGYGVAPIIGVDYKMDDKFNFAAKYEFKTRMRLENRASNSELVKYIPQLERFADGRINADDSPALLTLGAQYSVLPNVRLNAGWHHYFDKDGHQHDDMQKKLGGDTNEYLFGAEWDVCDRITVSAGGQRTVYDLADGYMDDISFNVSSTSLGFGAKVKVAKNLDVNIAYFQTFYQDYERHQTDYNNVGATINGIAGGITKTLTDGLQTPQGQALAQLAGLNAPQLNAAMQGIMGQIQKTDFSGSDKFTRTNRVIGIGVDWTF